MADRFSVIFERVIGHEGEYVNDPRDPGGETKYGISKRSYPDLDIAALTMDEAREIYRDDYWLATGCDLLPAGIDYAVFDAAVNAGKSRAVKWLQEAVGTASDGRIGPATRAAIKRAMRNPVAVLEMVNALRMQHYMELDDMNDRFGLGWARRMFQVHGDALGDARVG